RVEPGPDAAVVNIAAHLDAQPADQRRAVDESGGESPAVEACETGLDGGPQIRRQGRGALDRGRAPGEVELQQLAEIRQYGRTIVAPGRDDELHRPPDAVLVEHAVQHAITEQFLGFPSHPFAGPHGYAAICFAVSSARRR